MKSVLPILTAALTAARLAVAAPPDPEFPPAPPVLPLTPEEELKTIQLQPGYHLELVVSDPDIKEPTMISFDGDGRMYVVEMRTYMQDIEGNGEHEPTSRVSVHWSSKGDGHYDQHAIFADHLLLPRMLLPLDKGRVLIGETDTSDVMLHTDTDGDGVADKKEPWFVAGPRGGNMEHQPNGMQWGMDNWIYSTYNSFRLRWNGTGEPGKEATAANSGQWGVGQDDFGKIWFVNAGGERGPLNFQTGIVYGAFNLKDQFATDFDKVWPLVGLADVQGGANRYRPENKTLNHFTATCGAEIYRGDQMPELRGDLFFGEPVGRLIRRAKVEVQDGLTRLSNPYGESEFIRATDPLFRPINFATAPDGSLYIVDMYRGIIQEGNWVKEGSYLRKAVQQYALDKPVSHGRVWRLVPDGPGKPAAQPKMNGETAAQLVAHLENPNGWWRDTAQKLLVIKRDKSVAPDLAAMARESKNPLARLHALWTLEGLDALTPDLVREKLQDSRPELRAGALRVSETLYKKGDKSFEADIRAAAQDKDQSVALQSFLTAKLLNFPDWKKSLELVAMNAPLGALREIGGQILHPPAQIATNKFTPAELKVYKAGESTFQSLCAACHGVDGKGMPMVGAAPGTMLAPSFLESKTVRGWRDGPIYVLLHGLNGEIDGRKYEGQMVSMATNDDAWIASVLSYVRKTFGGGASFVTTDQVKALRAATKDRTQPWTVAELRAAMPQPLANAKAWKLTASDKPDGCASAIDGQPETRYSSGRGQTPGMWFQIELPQETEVVGIELDTMKSPNDYPRGYKVETSADGNAWGKPIATGAGNGPVTDIEFPMTRAKFIRITQTGTVAGNFWSIHELSIFAAKQSAKVASTR